MRMMIDQIVGDLGISHRLSPLALARSLANPNPDSKVPVVCQQWTLQWSTMVNNAEDNGQQWPQDDGFDIGD